MPKEQVLNTRIAAEDLEALKRAAEISGVSTSAFVTQAALREAEAVFAQADRTVMPADMFELLMDSLTIPDPAPRLRAAFERNPV